MDQVEGAGYGGKIQPMDSKLVANLIHHRVVDLFRQRGQPDAGEIELDALDSMLGDGLQQLAQGWARKRFCKNSDLHCEPPQS
jgi:hypothetical protein